MTLIFFSMGVDGPAKENLCESVQRGAGVDENVERLLAFAVKLGLPGTVSSDWLSAS
jgi:hypothetical protein